MTSKTTQDSGGDASETGTLPVWLRAALAAVILAGLALRLVYPGTTVFCRDQARACALAEDIAGGSWQTAGLVNSGGFRNLPGYVYLLAAVWRIVPHPMGLLMFTGIVNVLGVLLAWWLIRRWIGPAGAWWATALFATAPWAIHYCRWIFAQHLIFPAALMAYLFAWLWLRRGKRWAALGVVLSLTLLVQIHLVGVVGALAIGLLALWCRRRVPAGPVAVGVIVAVLSVLPYLLDGQLDRPAGSRVGYRHWWRAGPSAAMSVTGLWWQLEFKGGYPAFAESLSHRRWAYEAVMALPALLLAAGVAAGLGRLWRVRRAGPDRRAAPLAMAAALVVLIPLSFMVLGVRTSPTYLPVWYPLPFVLMGWMAQRLWSPSGRRRRGWAAALLVGVMCAQLAFFAEQLRYVHLRGGVPGGLTGRSYAGMKSDVAELARRIDREEVWMVYEDPSSIQDGPAAWMFRHARWAGNEPGRALIRFRWRHTPAVQPSVVETLPEGVDPPEGAYLVRPWTGPQQRGGVIPSQPSGSPGSGTKGRD